MVKIAFSDFVALGSIVLVFHKYILLSLFNMLYCKLVIIHHVPIFAFFVSVHNDEFTYWRV